jgi:hypothetical protein
MMESLLRVKVSSTVELLRLLVIRVSKYSMSFVK